MAVTQQPTGGPALVSDRRAEVGRRRVAPKAVETSDVTRYRGVLLATILGAVVLGAVLAASWASGTSMVDARPLSRPHRVAKLECEKCHKDPSDDPSKALEACSNCHGPHPSARRGHLALSQAGAFRCTTCHPIHGADSGVTFAADGTVYRYAWGRDDEVAGVTPAFLGEGSQTVPLVTASSCATCHALDNPKDPASGCFVTGQEALGPKRPAVCFDEHRDLLTSTGIGRSATWEAARKVAEAHPTVSASAPTRSGKPAIWVGSGLLSALVFLGFYRGASRLLKRERKTTELPQHAVLPAKVIRLPQINTNTCIGCHACVDACPYDVLEVHNYVAQLIRPDDCCGLTLCEQRCPNGSLIVTDGDPIEDRPHMSDALESLDSPGVFLAGDLTGLPLIRNAINQGTHVVKTIVKRLGHSRGGDMLDLVIIGGGPAGMAASLEAKSAGLRYATLEQGSVAESIRSFPRGKLVFDQPLGLPLIGDLWLQKSNKEELLAKWMRIVHSEKLAIYEGHRVVGIDRMDGGPPQGHLQVRYLNPSGQEMAMATRRVLLAFGRRGSPRKLAAEIPDAAQDHVHYSLADARTFAGKRVVVIGLGDVAMETAIAIANQHGSEVTVSYRGDEFRRGKTKNVEEVKRLAGAGRINLLLRTEVASVQAGVITLTGPEGPIRVPNDAVFVMIGTIAPWKFLELCGVKRVTHAATPALPPGPEVAASPPPQMPSA